MRIPFSALMMGALAVAVAARAPALRAQSLLDRPDNLSTDWVGETGTLYFNFVHRFSESPPPERKVSNFPTFLIATGFSSRALVGVNYATNSDLAARYPNEYELFARYAPLQQDDGAPLDVGGQLGYNVAVRGVDAELSVARREGPLRLVAAGRTIADTLGGSTRRVALGGGGTLRLGRFIALAADVSTLSNRSASARAAWSAGVHLALPNTPHTLSLHVSNATTSTLQGLARGGSVKRYGFEFTIPVHLRRFFQPTEAASAAPAMAAASESAAPGSASTTPVTTATSAPAPLPATATPATATPATATPATATPATATPATATPRIETPSASPSASDTAARTAIAERASRPAPALRKRVVTQQKVFAARMKNQAYIPPHIEIEAGTTVQWKNQDALIHTVTAVDRSFDSGVIAADGSYSHTFTRPGTYAVFCLAHPFMKATITVK